MSSPIWTRPFLKRFLCRKRGQVFCGNETFRIRRALTECWKLWHIGGIRPTVSFDAALTGNLVPHDMPWAFAPLVPCRMHRLVLYSMRSPSRRMCCARLLVIGPGQTPFMASVLSCNMQRTYLKLSS